MNGLYEPMAQLRGDPMDESMDESFGLLRQSYAGAVRQRLLAIERSVQAGQRHERILQEMQKQGLLASMGTFRKSLSRARIWWRRELLLKQLQNQALWGAPVQALTHEGLLTASPQLVGQSDERTHGTHAKSATSVVSADAMPHVRLPVTSSNPGPRAQRVDLDQFFKPKSMFAKS